MKESIRVWDLHCDTITDGCQNGYGLRGNRAHFDLDRLPRDWGWCQTTAIFIPDNYRGQRAVDYFEKNYTYFLHQLEENGEKAGQARSAGEADALLEAGKTALVLSVEGGAALGGRLETVERLRECGVRMLTLTWNGENELGGGAATDMGLTEFGRDALRELEGAGIAADVSHLCDRALEDVLKAARRPVLATHSDSRAVCGHRRNLTDGQFRAIAEMGGIVGINFCCPFIDPCGQWQEGDGERALACGRVAPDMLLRHIWHFLELGGEDALALGSDFDGCTIPGFIGDASGLATLRESMLQSGLGKELTHKILFQNAHDFLERYDKLR